jgi:hypothetical protein
LALGCVGCGIAGEGGGRLSAITGRLTSYPLLCTSNPELLGIGAMGESW